VVEADIHGGFDPRDQGWWLERRRGRMEDRALRGLLRQWLQAGIVETDSRGLHPDPGPPQGGVGSPGLATV
jgi:retron-type reverse transcriptase